MAQKFTERQFTTLPGGAVTDHSMLRMERITTNQSIPDITDTVVVFDTLNFEVDDTGRITPNTGTGVVTVNEAGIYRVTACAEFAFNATGRRILAINAGGAVVAEHDDDTSGVSAWSSCISTLVKLAAAETIDVRVFQSSGGSLNLLGSVRTHMTVEWTGPSS